MYLAYWQLNEMDRLEGAQTTDARYHQAKLTAAALGEPKLIWEEQEAWRRDLLHLDSTTPDLMKAGADLHQRAIERGMIDPPPARSE